MNPLSGAASMITVVQVAGKVWSLCWEYYSGAGNAKLDIDRLMGCTLALQILLQHVWDLAKGLGAAKLVASKELIESTALELEWEFKLLQKVLELGGGKTSPNCVWSGHCKRRMWKKSFSYLSGIRQLCMTPITLSKKICTRLTNTLILLERLFFILVITQRKVISRCRPGNSKNIFRSYQLRKVQHKTTDSGNMKTTVCQVPR